MRRLTLALSTTLVVFTFVTVSSIALTYFISSQSLSSGLSMLAGMISGSIGFTYVADKW